MELEEITANKLIEKFKPLIVWDNYTVDNVEIDACKKCAIICAESHIYSENSSPFITMTEWIENDKFWRKVKTILEKRLNDE